MNPGYGRSKYFFQKRKRNLKQLINFCPHFHSMTAAVETTSTEHNFFHQDYIKQLDYCILTHLALFVASAAFTISSPSRRNSKRYLMYIRHGGNFYKKEDKNREDRKQRKRTSSSVENNLKLLL